MIKHFRVLAISKETKSYETDLIRGIFGCNNPTLDVVDTLPPSTTLNVITGDGWNPISDGIVTETHICIPFVKEDE